MGARVTSCPNCGGQVEFKAGSSLLAICSYCDSAVARVGDDIGELEILGQVAPLADLGSPLELGVSGKLDGKSFTLIGRHQLDYGLGPWDEWYVSFDDGRWGWLAEAQGKVYMTFPQQVPDLPTFKQFRVGTRFDLLGQQIVVVERRKAKYKAAQGELPFAMAPGSPMYYCDIEAPGGIFGTLDFGSDQNIDGVYLGKQYEYSDLFSKDVLREREASEAMGVDQSCPNCGSSVELRAPDEAMRVTCPACDSLLDCSKGSELFLLHAAKRSGREPAIPLGTKGKYRTLEWTVYGHLIRSVTVDYVKYSWQEYLLRNDEKGWRWLINNNGHWTWMDPISASEIKVFGLTARCRGERFRHFQGSAARVEVLRGEFYWKVGIGEVTAMTDWVAPPKLLSRERSDAEVNCSIGHYLTPEEVQKIFKLKNALPKPYGVSPNQPNPHAAGRKRVGTLALMFTAVLFVLAFMLAVGSDDTKIYSARHPITQVRNTNDKAAVAATVAITDGFQLAGPNNLSVRVRSDVNNSWVYVSGALINEDNSTVRQFGVEVSYYHGYSGGESWSEGSRSRTEYLGSVKPGNYVLRLQPIVDKRARKVPTYYQIEVRSDVFMPSHTVFMLFALWVFPLLILARYFAFEKKRWAESDHAG